VNILLAATKIATITHRQDPLELTVIGGGLAGCEAAWQAASRGIKVKLIEMRPLKNTPAHKTEYLSELVCSNSLRSDSLENAAGLLKLEMRELNSLIIDCADKTRLPAGSALAVDRVLFSKLVTEKIESHPNIELIRNEATEIPESGTVIIATGPLTSDSMAESISEKTGSEHLHFYDAAAPIVTTCSVNMNKAFWGSRYGKGDEQAYLNCPMTKEEYDLFYNELIHAETHKPKDFEQLNFFEGCMPVEAMALRGYRTLLFGPLKPVGLIPPDNSKLFAVVQLRKDNISGTLMNIVGFQTCLKWNEQKRVFTKIPGLENADFVRYGFIHRNTYIDSPKLLMPTLQLKQQPRVFFAGQITGVEGYIESAACGLIAGINAYSWLCGYEIQVLPEDTIIGALINYITMQNAGEFSPMKANFGILPPTININKKDKKHYLVQRALNSIKTYIKRNESVK
jgi:methylenetetrahydrofolate--tRNA-(uracil-5-)-methyltransferase